MCAAVKQECVSLEGSCNLAPPTLHDSVKRHLIDSQQEAITPNTKRIKQERDDPTFCVNNEVPLQTSLHSIVSEVANSFENNPHENIIKESYEGNSRFDSASKTQSAQDDVILVLVDTEPSPQFTDDVQPRHENIEALPSPADRKEKEISVLSTADQMQVGPIKPILRTIKSLDSGKREGYAFDHNCFPKLVGVHSISSLASTSPEIESRRNSTQTSGSPEAIENSDWDQNFRDAAKTHNNICCTDTNASLRANSILINPPNPASATETERDLLFTFTQKDGKTDMFLVVNGEVFSVRRFAHEGESYLIHTDNNGKTTILAKLPEEANVTPHNTGTGTASSQHFSNRPSGTANDLVSSSEQSRNASYRRVASQYLTVAPVTITPVQSKFVRTFDVGTRKTGEPAAGPANSNQRKDFHRTPRIIQEQQNNTLLKANDVYGEREAMYGGMRGPNNSTIDLARNGSLNMERRQLPDQVNGLRTEISGQFITGLSPRVLAGQQRFPPQACASSHPRHHVESQQTSIAVHVNDTATRPTRASLNSLSNQQLVLNQNTAARDDRNNAMDAYSKQQYVNTTAQKIYTRDTVVGSGQNSVSPEEQRRILYRNKLMNYIANQLASGVEPSPSTTNASGYRRYDRTITNESPRRKVQCSTRIEVVPHPQSHDTDSYLIQENTDRHYTGRRNNPVFGNNLETRNADHPYPVNQMARQNSGLSNSQPHRSDASRHSGNPVQGELRDTLQGGLPSPMQGGFPNPMQGELPNPVQGGLPNPLQAGLPNPVQGELRDATQGALPNPVHGGLSNPVHGGLPNPMQGELRDPTQGALPNPFQGGLPKNDGGNAHTKILQIIESWQQQKQRISSSNDSPQLRELLVGTAATAGITTQTSVAEETLSRDIAIESYRAVQTSSDTCATPVISQISYGVINRSTGGEKVFPKRTATAIVVDQGRSIYVDATDSVMDEERRPGLDDQQLSNKGITISDLRPYQSGNVAILFPASSGAAVSGRLQDPLPTRNNSITAGQPELLRVVSTARSSTNIPSSTSQSDQGSKSVSESQRFYTSDRLPRRIPKFDKRCVANNTLKEILQTNNSSPKVSAANKVIGGQRSYTDVVQTTNADIVEIIIDLPPKQVSQPNTTVYSKSTEKEMRVGAGGDKAMSQTTPEIAKPCDDDEDNIVEIIIPTPERNYQSNLTRDSENVNKVVLISDEERCTKDERPSKGTVTAEAEKVEIVLSPLQQNSQPQTTVSLKGETKDNIIHNQQGCADYSETDDVVEVLTPTRIQNSKTKTIDVLEQNDIDTSMCDQRSCNDGVTLTSPVKKLSEFVEMLPSVPKDTTELPENQKSKNFLAMAEQYSEELELKTAQQKDELLKKIKNTRERIAEEKIDWKKKYLHRLEVVLTKKLAKLPGGSELTVSEKDDD